MNKERQPSESGKKRNRLGCKNEHSSGQTFPRASELYKIHKARLDFLENQYRQELKDNQTKQKNTLENQENENN